MSRYRLSIKVKEGDCEREDIYKNITHDRATGIIHREMIENYNKEYFQITVVNLGKKPKNYEKN